jgi:hypothetical protein
MATKLIDYLPNVDSLIAASLGRFVQIYPLQIVPRKKRVA